MIEKICYVEELDDRVEGETERKNEPTNEEIGVAVVASVFDVYLNPKIDEGKRTKSISKLRQALSPCYN